MYVEQKTLTYTSWARPGILPEEIEAIVSSARINNPLDGLTGVLIFNGTSFMQILEGSHAAVDDLAERLASDPRHYRMSIRNEGPITARTFPDWSMAFVRLENGRFEGEQAVVRALQRDLPPALRNVMVEMTRTLVRPRPAR